jgi:hypothetical protein
MDIDSMDYYRCGHEVTQVILEGKERGKRFPGGGSRKQNIIDNHGCEW